MSTKSLVLRSLLATLLFILNTSVCVAWTEHANVSYLDLDGDLSSEIIIETKHGSGTGHYVEDMRVFKDTYPELQLLLVVRTLDSYFDGDIQFDKISKVTFSEPDQETGKRNVVIESKKVFYADPGHKQVIKEERSGTREFEWNGWELELVGAIDYEGYWQTANTGYIFSMTLEQQANKVTGSYCSIHNPEGWISQRIDCDFDNKDLNPISGLIKDGSAIVEFKSQGWSGKGKAEISTHDGITLHWEIVDGSVDGECWCPTTAVLKRRF